MNTFILELYKFYFILELLCLNVTCNENEHCEVEGKVLPNLTFEDPVGVCRCGSAKSCNTIEKPICDDYNGRCIKGKNYLDFLLHENCINMP